MYMCMYILTIKAVAATFCNGSEVFLILWCVVPLRDTFVFFRVHCVWVSSVGQVLEKHQG